MPNMKTNTRLLEMLVNYWDPEEDAFMIDQMPLWIEVEYIYFITGISRRGVPVNLQGKARGSLNVDYYIHIDCPRNNEKVGTQIPI